MDRMLQGSNNRREYRSDISDCEGAKVSEDEKREGGVRGEGKDENNDVLPLHAEYDKPDEILLRMSFVAPRAIGIAHSCSEIVGPLPHYEATTPRP